MCCIRVFKCIDSILKCNSCIRPCSKLQFMIGITSLLRLIYKIPELVRRVCFHWNNLAESTCTHSSTDSDLKNGCSRSFPSLLC